jgi:hypothetical protein
MITITNTDNPHYVTPEEAIKKICPLKATSDVDDVSGQCVSHECMAWRWHEYSVEIPEEERTGPRTWRQVRSTTHGYCGMVRHD